MTMSETLKARIREDLNQSRRARDKERTTLLTTILSDLKYREVEMKRDANDAEVVDVVTKGIKRRREAADQMRAGNRVDLAEKEEAEAAILSEYLPAQLSETEVRQMIEQAIAEGAATIGAVMGKISPRIKGSFDGRDANRIAREMLGA